MLLVTLEGWDAAPWVEHFAKLLPGRMIVTPEQNFAPEDITYAATWKHRPG